MSPETLIEVGYWCESEGVYFTDLHEHDSEEEWRRNGCGPLGHYGEECPGCARTIRVAVVRFPVLAHAIAPAGSCYMCKREMHMLWTAKVNYGETREELYCTSCLRSMLFNGEDRR